MQNTGIALEKTHLKGLRPITMKKNCHNKTNSFIFFKENRGRSTDKATNRFDMLMMG